MKRIYVPVIIFLIFSVTAAGAANQQELTFVLNPSPAEIHVKMLAEKITHEMGTLIKDYEVQKKALAEVTTTVSEKNKTIAALRSEIAEAVNSEILTKQIVLKQVALAKEFETQKKALAEMTASVSDKEKTIAVLRSQISEVSKDAAVKQASLVKEYEVQKKALAEMATTASDNDKIVASLRTQVADITKKLTTLQISSEAEVFKLLSTDTTDSIKLRDFGSVKLIPLFNDYLVIIPSELSSKVDFFFSKIQKRVVVGKAATYLICDRKYFVPAPASNPVDKTGARL